MRLIYLVIICVLSFSAAYAKNDLTCVGDIETIDNPMWSGVSKVSVGFVDSIMTVSYIDNGVLYKIEGFAQPDIMSFHLLLLFKKYDQEYGIVVDLMTMEGKLNWGDEFLSMVKCQYLN